METMASDIIDEIIEEGKGFASQAALDRLDDVYPQNNLTITEKLELSLSMAEALRDLHECEGGTIIHSDFHIEQFSRKLLIAFPYMCFGKPLSETGGAFAWVHTNFDWAAGRFPNEILELAERVAVPSRQKAFLGDQFGVRWNSLDEPRSAVFVAHIHASMIISGITTECPTDFKSSKSERLLRPWKW